jgi:hypothetical protein
MPVTFYNDHYDLLLGQDSLFARKISPEAFELKERLGELFVSGRKDFEISNEGRNLFGFLSGRGRVGRRFGTRFWEREATLGRDHELMIIACKKWHVAKRLVAAIKEKTDIPAMEFLFNEEGSDLPDLGGLENSVAKRARHRRALIRMLFEHSGQNRMVICLDPANFDLIEDFVGDKAKVRLLEINCEFSDDYLEGHAKRVGLASEHSPTDTIARLIPTIRNDVTFESERLRDADFSHFDRLRERADIGEQAAVLARFLDVDLETAKALAETPYLFVD